MDITMDKDTGMRTLRRIYQTVSNEGIVFDTVAGVLRNMIGNLVAGFRTVTTELFGSSKLLTTVEAPTDFYKTVDILGFSNLSAVKCAVPQGLISTYLEYISALDHAVTYFEKHLLQSLETYAVLLGSTVSNKDAGKDTLTLVGKFDLIAKERDELIKFLSKHFQKNSVTAQQPYSKVVRKNSEWPEVVSAFNALAGRINKIDRAEVQRLIAACGEYLDEIETMSKANKLEHVSTAVVGNIAALTYHCAEDADLSLC